MVMNLVEDLERVYIYFMIRFIYTQQNDTATADNEGIAIELSKNVHIVQNCIHTLHGSQDNCPW